MAHDKQRNAGRAQGVATPGEAAWFACTCCCVRVRNQYSPHHSQDHSHHLFPSPRSPSPDKPEGREFLPPISSNSPPLPSPYHLITCSADNRPVVHSPSRRSLACLPSFPFLPSFMMFVQRLHDLPGTFIDFLASVVRTSYRIGCFGNLLVMWGSVVDCWKKVR